LAQGWYFSETNVQKIGARPVGPCKGARGGRETVETTGLPKPKASLGKPQEMTGVFMREEMPKSPRH